MNDITKQIFKYLGVGSIGIVGILIGSYINHNVKYELPPESKIIMEDNCGTDGSDPRKVMVVVRIPNKDGTFREVRIRKSQIKFDSLSKLLNSN